MTIGWGGEGFCPPGQTDNVRVFSYPFQFLTGIKTKNPNPYPMWFEYLREVRIYAFELHFDIFLLRKELKIENYFF
jgi:hypothetical protein